MIKITSVTEARQNLPSLVKLSKEPVVIVQNSKPMAVLISYKDFSKWQAAEEQKEFLEMVKNSPSYKESEDEPDNFDPHDLKPLKK
jgi:prevent-host-death family protein